MISTHALRAAAVCTLFAIGCGNNIDKPKKGVPSNNSSANSMMNNVATNNVATNNVTTTNNVTNNNSTTTNNVTNNNSTTTNNNTNNPPCVGIAPASLNFGQVLLGEMGSASVTIENCSATAPLLLTGLTAPDGFDAQLPAAEELAPLTTANATIEFRPVAATAYTGQVTFETLAGPAVVNVQGEGIDLNEMCPTALPRGRAESTDPWTASVTALPNTTVQLTGAASMGQSAITSYEWNLVTRPAGSTARLTPSATIEAPSLFVDLEGVYEADLRVATANSPDNCPAARMTINVRDAAVDPNAITVSVTWDTPADADQTDSIGTDIDLHYRHPLGTWNAAPYDCYWLNPNADWGVDGLAKVDIDDTDGAGPETISHANASAKIYDVGVYYYADNGFGTSTPTVRITRGGMLLAQQSLAMTQSGTFWLVGSLDAGTDVFTPQTTITNGFP